MQPPKQDSLMAVAEVLIHFIIAFFIGRSAGQLCGTQAGAALCPNGRCCSQFGTGSLESQCLGSNTTTSDGIITESLFNQMLKHRDDPRCPGNGFYTYSAFTVAALSFIGFGTTGDLDTRKREVAAFLGQTSHETTGGWASAPDGPYAWGYCYVRESGVPGDYCSPSASWPCASGQQYYGRGPIQLAYNFNYGEAGRSLGVDLINNPDLVATDAIVSFKTAIWFWMTPLGNGPSCHSVITGLWKPSNADRAGGRLPGYGLITNIINGGSECRTQEDSRAADRIGFYKRYCDLLGVTYGSNLHCYNQSSF